MGMKRNSFAWAMSMVIATALSCTGCSDSGSSNSSEASAAHATTSISAEALSSLDGAYDADDFTDQYDTFDAKLQCKGDTVTVTGNTDAVQVDGQHVTISEGGVYAVTGTLENGQLEIAGSEKVKLYLDGVSITSEEGPAIVCNNEKRTILSLAPDTENVLTGGSKDGDTASDADETEDTDTEAETAGIYAADSLTINGAGSLTVQAPYGNGIVSDQHLRLTGGTITVDAANNGMKGKDSLTMYDGTVTITAGNDGMKSTKTEDESKGYVVTSGGSVTISANGDGIQSETLLQIEGGTIQVETTGEVASSSGQDAFDPGQGGMPGGNGDAPTPPDGADFSQMPQDAQVHDGSMPEPPTGQPDGTAQNGGTPPELPSGAGTGQTPPDSNAAPGQQETDASSTQTTAEQDSSSTTTTTTADQDASSKGLKAGGDLVITGGTISVTSTDHAVHAAGNGSISGASMQIDSDQKGISVHGDLTIDGADTEIVIDRCTEGVESKATLSVEDGTIRILDASDDGLNTGGTTGDHTMTINGGYLYVNAKGDGLDSNGSLVFHGGVVVVSGPVSGADGSLDSDGTMVYNGGIVMGLSSRGMMEYPESGCLVATNLEASAGDSIAVVAEDGTVLSVFQTEKAVSDLIYASADASSDSCQIVIGGTYDGTLNADGYGTGGTITGGTAVTASDASSMPQQGGGGAGGSFGFGGGGQTPPNA